MKKKNYAKSCLNNMRPIEQKQHHNIESVFHVYTPCISPVYRVYSIYIHSV